VPPKFTYLKAVLLAANCLVLAPFALATEHLNPQDEMRTLAVEGDAAAQYNMGIRYLQGQGVKKSSPVAEQWFKRAAKQGLPQAQYNLGVIYAKGDGVFKDVDKALNWFKSPELKTDQRAVAWITKITAQQAEQKQKTASDYYKDHELKLDHDVMPMPETLKVSYVLESPFEPQKAGVNPSVMVSKTTPVAVTKARPVKKRSIHLIKPRDAASKRPVKRIKHVDSRTKALFDKAMIYKFGQEGIPRDLAKAFSFFKQAADNGYAPAQYEMAVAYINGEGVARSFVTAFVYVSAATKNDHAKAGIIKEVLKQKMTSTQRHHAQQLVNKLIQERH